GMDTVRPHLEEAKERVQSAGSEGQYQQRPSRLRAMQAGVAVAGVGVVGVLIGSLATPAERPAIQDTASVASSPAQETNDPQVIAKGAADSRNGEAKSSAAKAQEGMNIPPNAEGIDVSNHNGSVDWNQVAASGKKFAFVL